MAGQERSDAETGLASTATPADGSRDEGYVFSENARRWRFIRAGLVTGGAVFTALAGLLVALCLEPPDLPDLNLKPSALPPQRASVPAAATPRAERRIARSETSLLRRLSRMISPARRHRSRGGVRNASARLVRVGRRL